MMKARAEVVMLDRCFQSILLIIFIDIILARSMCRHIVAPREFQAEKEDTCENERGASGRRSAYVNPPR
jgi:hypothetical protein